VLLSTISASSSSAGSRRSEIGAILKAWIARMKLCVAIQDSESADNPAKSPYFALSFPEYAILCDQRVQRPVSQFSQESKSKATAHQSGKRLFVWLFGESNRFASA